MIRLAVATIAFMLSSPSSAYTVTIDSDASVVRGIIQSATYRTDSVSPTEFEVERTFEFATLDGSVSSRFYLGTSGFDFAFSKQHDLMRVGTGVTAFGVISFHVDEDILYEASGSYSSQSSISTRYFADLIDVTADSTSFASEQWTTHDFALSFVLGETEGTHRNTSSGSLSGVLLAGHQYEFGYLIEIANFPTASGPGTKSGSGDLTLSFAPVPEPSTSILVAMGLAFFGSKQRRKLK